MFRSPNVRKEYFQRIETMGFLQDVAAVSLDGKRDFVRPTLDIGLHEPSCPSAKGPSGAAKPRPRLVPEWYPSSIPEQDQGAEDSVLRRSGAPGPSNELLFIYLLAFRPIALGQRNLAVGFGAGSPMRSQLGMMSPGLTS